MNKWKKLDKEQEERRVKLRREVDEKLATALDNKERRQRLESISDEEWAEAQRKDAELAAFEPVV